MSEKFEEHLFQTFRLMFEGSDEDKKMWLRRMARKYSNLLPLVEKFEAQGSPLRKSRVSFSFDERSFEPLDKLIQQGRYPGNSSTNLSDYKEVEVKNPETGEVRIVVIPK